MNNRRPQSDIAGVSRRDFLRRGAGLAGGLAAGAFLPECLLGSDLSKKSRRDLTFFVLADTHYGRNQAKNKEANNKMVIDEMNSAPGTLLYPKSLGEGKINTPRGVLVAGDLTEDGLKNEWIGVRGEDGFITDYGLRCERRLKYPVYEGFGNHDSELSGKEHYPLDRLKIRNKSRKGITNLSKDGFHYSWDWDDVHFINLNLYPGPKGGRPCEAEGSIDFLKEDLVAEVGKSGRPVVIYHHFGLDEHSGNAWGAGDKDIYYEIIKDYNIVAIFHGHIHESMVYQWRGIDIYNVGAGLSGEWSAVNITDDELIFANRSKEGWNVMARKKLEAVAVK